MAQTSSIGVALILITFGSASSFIYSGAAFTARFLPPSLLNVFQKMYDHNAKAFGPYDKIYQLLEKKPNPVFPGVGSISQTCETLEETYSPDLTQACLGCICEATSNCNLTIGCTGRLCGPFLISKRYWVDAGRPVIHQDHPDRRGAFETCANDPYCAAQTLKQYVFRFAQDCNRNGILDCDDYARIHYLGGHQCYLPIHQYCYYSVFRECQAAVQFLN